MSFWIEVKVKPQSKESSLRKDDHGGWIARIKSPPVDGKANRELISLVAKEFGVPKRSVVIKTGASSRIKQLRVETS